MFGVWTSISFLSYSFLICYDWCGWKRAPKCQVNMKINSYKYRKCVRSWMKLLIQQSDGFETHNTQCNVCFGLPSPVFICELRISIVIIENSEVPDLWSNFKYGCKHGTDILLDDDHLKFDRLDFSILTRMSCRKRNEWKSNEWMWDGCFLSPVFASCILYTPCGGLKRSDQTENVAQNHQRKKICRKILSILIFSLMEQDDVSSGERWFESSLIFMHIEQWNNVVDPNHVYIRFDKRK